MARLDRRGLPLSTTSDRAADHYRDGVDLLLAAWPGAAEALEEAIAADPDFALAHAARARLHAIRAEPTEARARIATAAAAVARHGTERERSHVEILSLAIHGQAAQALERALAHAEAWPRDVLIRRAQRGDGRRAVRSGEARRCPSRTRSSPAGPDPGRAAWSRAC